MKKWIAAALSLGMALLLGSCGAAGGADPADSFHIELRLSHVFAPEELFTLEIEQVAERIRERTDGAVDIRTYGSSQLDVYKENLQHVVSGDYWIACEDPSYLADYGIDFEALIAPMLYSTPEEYSYVCQSDVVRDMCRDVEDNYGIHVLALDFIAGMRSMQTNKVITTPEDMRGMRIRVPNSSMYINFITAMGAEPIPMAFSKALSAVLVGEADGLEGNINAYAANGAADVVKQVSLTNHLIAACGAYISTNVWYSIPEEYQAVIEEEFAAGAREMTARSRASIDAARKTLEEEKDCRFNEVDVEAFRAVMEPEYERMVREDGVTEGLIPQLRNLASEYVPAAEETD